MGATPRPVTELTANALAIHDVMVSGTLVWIVALPSDLKETNSPSTEIVLYSMNMLVKICMTVRGSYEMLIESYSNWTSIITRVTLAMSLILWMVNVAP